MSTEKVGFKSRRGSYTTPSHLEKNSPYTRGMCKRGYGNENESFSRAVNLRDNTLEDEFRGKKKNSTTSRLNDRINYFIEENHSVKWIVRFSFFRFTLLTFLLLFRRYVRANVLSRLSSYFSINYSDPDGSGLMDESVARIKFHSNQSTVLSY